MKRGFFVISFVLSLCATAGPVCAEGVEFGNGNLETMLSEASSADKLLLVELFATWCGPCRAMERTLAQDSVGDYINPRFVSVRYDVDKAEGAMIARKFGVRSIPVCLILDAEGNLVGKLVGAASPSDFITNMQRLVSNIGR